MIHVCTVGVAACFLLQSLRSLFAENACVNRSGLLAQSSFQLGIALFFYSVFPWWRLGFFARAATLCMLAIAGFVNLILALRGVSSFTQLRPVRASEHLFAALALILLIFSSAIFIWPTPRDATSISSPVNEGNWHVAHGGPLGITNHHNSVVEQRYAMDSVRLGSDGRSHVSPADVLSSYFAWGSEVISPVEGIVVSVVDGIPDMEIGNMDKYNPAGNHVLLETDSGVRVLIAHFQKDTLVVQEGNKVAVGDVLGKVGNSGNSSEPHIHLQVMKCHNGGWHGVPFKIDGKEYRRGRIVHAGSYR